MYEVYAKLRDQKGVTDYRIAQELGIPRSTFTQWKNKTSQPKADKLKKIADYFGVSLEYLQTGEMKETYYLNPETAKVAQEIVENKELALLFDAARDASPEDLITTHQMLLALKRKERHEDE